MKHEILIVDDEADIRTLIRGILEDEGYATRQARNSDEAYAMIAEREPSLVVQDIWLQDSRDDGLAILKTIKASAPHVPVLMISGHGTIETAVAAIKDGAYDFIEKPFKADRLLLMISRALENAKLLRENETLKRQMSRSRAELIGRSASIQTVEQMLERVAKTNSRILLSGEPGTGKDVVARLIHRRSARADGPFVIMNCATLRPDRFELELFGGLDVHGHGHVGFLEQAHEGTLLLDEVSDMPLETQGKIVRVLQEQRFQRLGSNETREVNVRVLASTNRDLEQLMHEGAFRQDLYYRLNVVPIHMAPLRERVSDIPDLANHFAQEFMHNMGQITAEKVFSPAALGLLKKYPWPGNIRQLRNVVEWVVIMHGSMEGAFFEVEHLPPEISGQSLVLPRGEAHGAAAGAVLSDKSAYLDLPLREAREVFEREYLSAQIERFEGNISRTAQFVGMERSALHRKLKTLNPGEGEEESDAVSPEGATSETDQKRKRA